MKTELELFIEWLDEKIEADKDGLFNLYVLQETKKRAVLLFEAEKKSIVDAFDYGYASGYDESQGDGETYSDGNDYYQKNYLNE